jgi:heme/copper-type cytochrome/quinol oxidase subunit 3
MGDLSHLDPHGHGRRSMTWWGMMGLIAIEGTAFVLAGVAYLYLAAVNPVWPPHGLAPSLGWGNAFTIVTLVSFLPNMWVKRVSEREQLQAVRLGLVVMSALGAALLVIRYFEFTALHVAWSDSAYGSITVTLLGLHTVHLATDLVDTVVLTALMYTRHARGRRYVDCAENAIYWNFVVFGWLPMYALIYWGPKWL